MKCTKQRNKPSLKWELIGIVVMCWILPVLVMVSVLGYYINGNINEQFVKSITASSQSAAELAAVRLNSAVTASRSLNYDGAIKSAQYDYRRTGDKMALYSETTEYLSRQYKYDDKFISAMLYFTDEPENIYYTYNEHYRGRFTTVRKYVSEVHSFVQKVVPSLGTGVKFLNVGDTIYMVRNVQNASERFAPFAVLVLELNTDVIFDGMKNIVWENGATLWLDDTRVVVSGTGIDKKYLDEAPVGADFTFLEHNGGSLIYGTQRLDTCNFSYIVEIDKIPLMEELSSFNFIFVSLLLLIVPLLMFAIWFFYRNISRPIGGLIAASKKIEVGEFGFQIEEGFGNKEFEFLSQAFNSMSSRIKTQFERIYSEELALRDARIMALQSQINPHFLNNTLEIINWEARLADNIKVSRMIEALSTMLDAAMDRKGKPVVRLSEEMMYVDAYLYIISERLGKRLTVKKEIDKTLLECFVPRLVLQPIIENAVEHGVQAQQQGVITIRAYLDNDFMILEIENNGTLTQKDEEHITRLLSSSYDASTENSGNLGIYNVNQRLKIIYGEDSGLSIKMNDTNHVLAKIVISNVKLEQ